MMTSQIPASNPSSTCLPLQYIIQLAKTKPICLEGALIALLPCLPLFNFSQILDHNDWYNHTWVMAYIGAYLHAHFAFPEVINANQAVGFPITIFYTFGFYNLLGAICAFFNPQVAILAAAYLILWAQYSSVALLLTRLTMPRWFSSASATMITFSIYPLTNLYNRNAISEFLANIAVTTAIAALLLSIISTHKKQKQYWYLLSLIMFGIMASTHPITLRLCADFVIIFCLLLLWLGQGMRREMLFRMAGVPLVLLPLLSSWLYAFFSVNGEVAINNAWVLSYPDDIDTISMRLSPVLFDRRFWEEPYSNITQISTPFLDAPANIFILGMAVALLLCSLRQYRNPLKLGIFAGIMSLVWLIYFWCSVSTYPYGHIVPVGYAICQFEYRMVNMLNLSAVSLLIGMAFWLKVQGKSLSFPDWVRMLTIVLLTSASLAFLQKMVHASSVLRPHPHFVMINPNYVRNLISFPSEYYGRDCYVSTQFYKNRTMSRPMPIDNKSTIFKVESEPFGEVKPITVNAYEDGWYRTNVYSFVWNKILVDGKEAERQVAPIENLTFNVHLKPGEHTLEYALDPPPFWRFLRYVSLITALTLFALWFAVVLRNAFGKKDPRFL